MRFSPQKREIYGLFKDGDWHCSSEIHFIRDYRKRISELNRANIEEKGAEMFESVKCDGRCKQNHRSNIHMYRLKERPREQKIIQKFSEDGRPYVQVIYA